MRNPIRSETDAFYLAVGGAAVTAGSVAVGAFVNPVAGGALFLGALSGAVLWEIATKDPERRRPLLEAAAEGRRQAAPSAQPRVLVVANRTLQGEELEETLRERASGGRELRIVAPILVSRARYLASDVDKEIAEAHQRLTAALAWAHGEGIQASGTVGDPTVALGAIEDELRMFAADEVLISTYPPGKSNWLETDIVRRLREELDIPVTHVIVEPDRAGLTARP